MVQRKLLIVTESGFVFIFWILSVAYLAAGNLRTSFIIMCAFNLVPLHRPSTLCISQHRLCYATVTNYPQTHWLMTTVV